MPVSLTLKHYQLESHFLRSPTSCRISRLWYQTQACNLRNSPCAQAWNFEETVLFLTLWLVSNVCSGRHTSSLFLWCEWTNQPELFGCELKQLMPYQWLGRAVAGHQDSNIGHSGLQSLPKKTQLASLHTYVNSVEMPSPGGEAEAPLWNIETEKDHISK